MLNLRSLNSQPALKTNLSPVLGREQFSRGSTQLDHHLQNYRSSCGTDNGVSRSPYWGEEALLGITLTGGFRRVDLEGNFQPRVPYFWQADLRLLVLVMAF